MNWYNIKKKFLSWVADIRIYPGGMILFGDSHYKIKGSHMRAIIDCVQPGDIILRRYSHYLGSVTIPGFWSHSAVYVEGNEIVHMLAEGIVKEDLLTFMRCDAICVLRHKDKEISAGAINKAYEQLALDVEYDYNFDTDNHKKFYCTEFVEYCFNYTIRGENTRGFFNIDTILPDEFFDCEDFEIIWNSKNGS